MHAMTQALALIATTLLLSLASGLSHAAPPATAEGRQKAATTAHQSCKGGDAAACAAFTKIWNGTLYDSGLNMYWAGSKFTIEMSELQSDSPPWKVSATLTTFDAKPTYSPTGQGFWAFKTVTMDYPKVSMSGDFGRLGKMSFEGQIVDPKAGGEAVITGTLTRVKRGKTTTEQVQLKTWEGG